MKLASVASGYSREIESIRSENVQSKDRIRVLERQLDGGSSRMKSLEVELASLRELAARRELRLHELTTARDKLADELDAARRLAAERVERIREIEESVTWRLTEPLRAMAKRVRSKGRVMARPKGS